MAIRKKPGSGSVNPITKSGGFSLEGTELGATIKEVSEAYGIHVARQLSRQVPYDTRIPTGIFSLDLALAGGMLISRGSMFYGERSSGKSTTAMRVARMAQIMYPDKAVVWLDIEGTFDEVWFMKLGGDPNRLIISEPESGEHAVDIGDAMVRSKETSVIVTDSIAMLVPTKEIEGSAEDSLPGVHARLVGNYLRRINNGLLKERHRGHRPLVLHINQFRMKIMGFGDPRTLPGGKALEFMTSQQVEMKNKEIIDDKSGAVKWNEHAFKITKDKTGGRFREGMFKMTRDPSHNRGVPDGTIDQGKSYLARTKEIGLTDGHKVLDRNGKVFGQYAGNDVLIEEWVKDPEKAAVMMLETIQAYRASWGLPTADD